MARSTDRHRSRKDAEDRFPIKIDIARAYGQPWPYADMLAWCFENVPTGASEQHGYMDWNRWDDNGAPTDFSRWYLMSDADAAAFKNLWGEEMTDLSDAPADKLQAALNHAAPDPDDDLGIEYRDARAVWFLSLTQGERWRLAMVLAAYERGAVADAEQLAAALPPAPVFPLP